MLKLKRNPDDRRDNVEKIKRNIDNTVRNMRAAEEMLNNTSDDKMREDLIEKNERRRDALAGFRREIKDEADYRESRRGR
jgi:small acid-soluble spore protein (thioredoxin-like protein)